MNTGRGAGRGETERTGRSTRLQHQTQIASGTKATERRAGIQPPPSRTPGQDGPAPARSSCLRQLTSDGLVFFLIFFGFPLICTEVIRHFRRSKNLSLLGDYTAPSSLPVALLPFPSSPEIRPAPRALLPQKRAEERHGGQALRRESSEGEWEGFAVTRERRSPLAPHRGEFPEQQIARSTQAQVAEFKSCFSHLNSVLLGNFFNLCALIFPLTSQHCGCIK